MGNRAYAKTVKHLGGLDGVKTGPVALKIADAGITVGHGWGKCEEIPWARIQSLDVDGSDEIERRVTATRLVALGVFAFAAKKKRPNVAYLSVTYVCGSCAIFELADIKPVELRGKLAPFRRHLAPAATSG